jgi:hypothetical protein
MAYTQCVEYISLGSDCSVAYQLDMLGLRKEAYPFDWIRCNRTEDIISLMENKFQHFFDEEYLIKEKEVDNFPLIKDDMILSNKSINIVMKHKLYSIIFPHEIRKGYEYLDMMIVKEKYMRRVNRFYDVCTNSIVKKVFVRITNKKDDYEKIDRCLKKFACNYELRIILIDKKTKYSNWKKDEIDWIKFIC